jgi:hypothetical protein
LENVVVNFSFEKGVPVRVMTDLAAVGVLHRHGKFLLDVGSASTTVS